MNSSPNRLSQSDSDTTTSVIDEVEIDIDLDDIIRRLTIDARKSGDRYTMDVNESKALAFVAKEIISKEPVLLAISAPIKICGDIHGQYLDLLRLFDLCGYPPKSRYLFLGDYVDRGRRGLEVICLLFAYKIKYPKSIFILRGNHESEMISNAYGFRQEIQERFHSSSLWKTMIRTFNWLPVAAVIENSIFCCHGGLSPLMLKASIGNLSEIFEQFKRPFDIPKHGLLCDLLWSDPMDQPANGEIPKGWKANERGCSWQFGFDVVDAFLEKYNLDLIVRGHQVVEDGYEFYCNRKLITVFSAPFYGGEYDNAGGIFCLEKDKDHEAGNLAILEAGFSILKPDYTLANQWFKSLKPKKKKKK